MAIYLLRFHIGIDQIDRLFVIYVRSLRHKNRLWKCFSCFCCIWHYARLKKVKFDWIMQVKLVFCFKLSKQVFWIGKAYTITIEIRSSSIFTSWIKLTLNGNIWALKSFTAPAITMPLELITMFELLVYTTENYIHLIDVGIERSIKMKLVWKKKRKKINIRILFRPGKESIFHKQYYI